MPPKRPHSNGSVGDASNVKKTCLTANITPQIPSLAGTSSSSVVSVPVEANREVAQGLKKSTHGIIYQLKLLKLFLMRGISAGQTFRLGTEMEDIGGKFDDLIFKYKVDDSTSNGDERYCYRYLQAKHKQNESLQITAAHLLNDKDGEFSLLKYFRSYCAIRSRGDDIQDCIICTNIDFNSENLQKKGIRLVPLETNDHMLTFRGPGVGRYAIEPNQALRKKLLDDPDANSIMNRTTGEDVSDFFDKLVFVVNTPNEVILGQLLTDEVGEHYKLHEANFVSDFILVRMLDWFKKKTSDFMTSEQGNEILRQGKQNLKSSHLTSVSIDYQNELRKGIEFNAGAIAEMAETLNTLLSLPNKIERLRTALPERTAVKLGAALKTLRRFKRKDSYLMTSSKRLRDAFQNFEDVLKFKYYYQLLVVVCGDGDDQNDDYYDNLFGDHQLKRKVIVLCRSDSIGAADNLQFADLSDGCQTTLLAKEVSFQGTIQTVGDLIQNGSHDEIIDAHSIEELLRGEKRVDIPLHNMNPGFDQNLYVRRQIILPFDDECLEELAAETHWTRDELQKKVQVTVRNNIEWHVDGSNKSQIWKAIKKVRRKRQQAAHASWVDNKISEEDLTAVKGWRNRVVVVSDVAGTGKSTMLSNCYRKMKEDQPDNWIIKLDLVDCIKALHKFDCDEVDQQSEAITFFIANIPNVENSPFCQSLLRHRLKRGEAIVVMLDGFDEIDSKCQDQCIALIKAIGLTKLNALYITTRPHLNESLQDLFFQLAYTLADFSRQDQIDYLSRYWEKKPQMLADPNIRSVATSIVDRLSTTLKGNERSFIGIPLQCHIVAECFEYQVCDIIKGRCSSDSLNQCIDSNLNLSTMYERLFMKKRDIYEQEKAKVQNVDNHILRGSLKDQMEHLELYLRDVAVKTIVSDQIQVDCLLGVSNDSIATMRRREEKQQKDSVCFGLLTLKKDEFQFLHRTYAEYLMANYLYEGFRLEEDLRNQLLNKKPISELIGSDILTGVQYQGVQLFFDSRLEEIVGPEEWRDMWRPMNDDEPSSYSQLPTPFSRFTHDLYRVYVDKALPQNALTVAIERQNDNIFELLCRFVDLTLEKSNILELMKPLFRNVESDWKHKRARKGVLHLFYNDRNWVGLKRLIDWHAGAHPDNILLMAKAVYFYAPFLRFHDSPINQPNQRIFFSQLIDFLIENGKIVEEDIIRLDEPHNRAFFCWHKLLKFCLFHEDCQPLLQRLVQLLLQTAGHDRLVFIVNKTFQNNLELFKQAELEKLSDVLTKMGRTDVLAQIPRQILLRAPELLRCVYSQQCDRSTWPAETNSLTRMNELHEMAFRGETRAVRDMLDSVRSEHLRSSVAETKKGAEEIVRCMTYRSGSNPFTLAYLAVYSGQEDLFRVMLDFVKKVLPSDELQTALTSKNGFLHGAYWDALEMKRIEALQLILKVVKEIMGPESQFNLIKSRRLKRCQDYTLINVLANTMTENDPEGFRYLNDLMFDDQQNIELLPYLDAQYLLGSKLAEGCDKWMRRLFDAAINFPGQFASLLLDPFLVEFSDEELAYFLDAIKSSGQKKTGSLSIWAKFVRGLCEDDNGLDYSASCLKRLFQHISQKLTETAVKELVLVDNGQVVERVTLRGYKEISDAMLAALPTTDREQVIKGQASNQHQVVFGQFLSEICWEKPQCYSNTVPILIDCLAEGSKEQLSRFVDRVTCVYEIQDKKFSIWNTFSDTMFAVEGNPGIDTEELMEFVAEKLDAAAIKVLLLHDIGKGAFFVRLMLWEEIRIVWDTLDRFPAADVKEALEGYLKNNGSEIIQAIFFSSPTEKLMAKMRKLGDKFSMNICRFFLDYGNEEQLALFMETVTSIHRIGSAKRSVWGIACRPMLKDDDILNDFFECVSKKLDKGAVKKLIFHCENNLLLDVVIIYALRKFWLCSCIKVMFLYLDDDGRNEVRRLVDSLPYHADLTRYGFHLKNNCRKFLGDASEQILNEI